MYTFDFISIIGHDNLKKKGQNFWRFYWKCFKTLKKKTLKATQNVGTGRTDKIRIGYTTF